MTPRLIWTNPDMPQTRPVSAKTSFRDKETLRLETSSSSSTAQEPGNRSRSRHLRMASFLTPRSKAQSLTLAQLSSKVSIPKDRDKLSPLSSDNKSGTIIPVRDHDGKGQNVRTNMARTPTFQQLFSARMKTARLDRGYTQADIAKLLGITEEAYKKSEQRGRLPLHLIETFCLATGIDIAGFLTTTGPVKLKVVS